MCTVVIRVPEPGPGRVRLLAIRDEDPGRPWRPVGQWWPQHPEITGIQDLSAGGAWLAHNHLQLSVLLNRAGGPPEGIIPTTRGDLVIGSLTGRQVPATPTTLGFNLVEATFDSVRVTSWEGGATRTVDLEPGTHMIAHSDVDDFGAERIAHWLHRFADAPTEGVRWWTQWAKVLDEGGRNLDPTDDRALIRDNRAHGFPTLSLLAVVASIGPGNVTSGMGVLGEPGVWEPVAPLLTSP
ncbi:NRDE family protein [Tessaracoccus sp. MC1865]|nr:NRDE family protein [Tessaracoccus sp. MC1865]MBB1483703.1 NRDE family protein [Tessaracoccus sp. MC1865]